MSPTAPASNGDVEEGLTPNEESVRKQKSVGLSTVSKQYDRKNKGYLDENEQKMREMDTSNRGFLTNDKVYSMLEEQAKLQKTLVTQRNLIIGLCVFAVILALANMGTAFAAANLSKDTSTDTASNLINKHTSDIIGTKAKGSVYDLDLDAAQNGRRLADPYDINGGTYMARPKANAIWADYSDGTDFVRLKYTCSGTEYYHDLASGGSRQGNSFTYGEVQVSCGGGGCSVCGLPGCSPCSGGAASSGTTACGNDILSNCVWTQCPNTFGVSLFSLQSAKCDSSAVGECSQDSGCTDCASGLPFEDDVTTSCDSNNGEFSPIATPGCQPCDDVPGKDSF